MKSNLKEEIKRMKTIMNVMGEVSDEMYKNIKDNYSNARIIMSKSNNIEFVPTPLSQQKIGFKPKGLWYGIGDSWISWVKSEMPDWERDNVFTIEIKENYILRITNYDELIEFENKYLTDDFDKNDRKSIIISRMGDKQINWTKVAEDFLGIEIAPYIYKARDSHRWYYGWDVASGCIWGDGVITKVTKLNDEQIAEIVTDKKVICDNCGWSWNKNEGGNDMYICHKCGTDNEPHNQLNENIVDDTLNEVRYDFLKWKRQNVTIRGVRELGSENNAGAQFGDGLYTAFLSNRDMARKYGDVYFVVNAKPKTPKVVNNTNDAEIFFQNIVNKWCKERGLKYDPRAFHEETDYKTEMLKMGYDGLVIKGREMVNYNPPDNVLYFKNEWELEDYYNKNSSFLNEQTFMGNFVWNHIKDITPDEDDVPWGFKDKIRNAEFENVPNFNLESLLETDPDFREYYESDDVRYSEDEVDPRDIELEIVVVDGELLDGYSRVAKLLRNGEKTTNAFVGKNITMNGEE
jgi:hypothetical protein